ncbi:MULTISPECIES: glycosyltransferase family 9 protein [Corallincola]|uniref:Lipopolysaccharide heptosyltransferase family protein n=2 Tax=Corallincola TaxID=1775176 RepID=A0A368NP31_9GAMM|nr:MULTISPECIES: glycosyltransferase family 9 protein [Corallincola]RCU51061.1 lipopolysaccharide heptosyltransferase family protein [Corallincola holothuriorum]TAA45992.1 lipopolysaccharide heptosyltransferase family protein [Corallincola spongiicola]
MSSLPYGAPHSICLLRLSSIGDVCHAVATVQAIQRRYPGVPVTWILGKAEASLLQGLPDVEIIVYDKTKGWQGILDVRQQLKRRKFDVLLHMQVAFRASILSAFISANKKYGFDRARAGEGQWLFSNRRIGKQTHAHVLEGFQAFGAAIGVPPPPHPLWQIPVSDSDSQYAQTVIPDGQPALIITPAASKAERNWTVAGYAAIADHAARQSLKVILCGGPSAMEKALGEQISQACQVAEPDNQIGKSSLKQLLALLGRARVVLAPDTGPAHMAVTQGTPVIGLYCHSNPRRTGPYLWPDYVINHYDRLCEQQHGKPWQKLPWGTRVKGDGLMAEITIDEVKAMFNRVLVEQSQRS